VRWSLVSVGESSPPPPSILSHPLLTWPSQNQNPSSRARKCFILLDPALAEQFAGLYAEAIAHNQEALAFAEEIGDADEIGLRGANGVGEWKMDWRGWQGRLKSDVKLPDVGEFKDSLHNMRQKMSIKRSRHDKLVMRVYGGLGQKFGINSNLVRLIWVALSIGSVGMGC
jgi:phage shock protein PspC (stress-responsive transcriptional regulator)